MKRIVTAFVILCALLAGAARCDARAITLTYWCSPYPNEAGWAITMTRLWNQTHPNVHVRLQRIPPGVVAEDFIRQAIRSHTTPDICSHLFPADVQDFVVRGGLLPLDRFPALLAASQQRSGASVLNGFRSADGHLYQIPWKCNPIMLQYNAGLLRHYGLVVPRTYTQFLAVADQLRQRARIYAWAPNPSDKWYKRYYDFYPLYFAAGSGRGFLDAHGRPAFNNPAAVEVLDFLRENWMRGYCPAQEIYRNDDALNEAFAAGRLAFLVTGPWNVPTIQEKAGDTVRFNFCPLPVPDATRPGPVYTYGNFRNIGIFTTCIHRREAAAFAQFLISRQADVAFLQMCSELPYRRGLFSDPSFSTLLRKNPYLATFARQLANVRPVANSPHFNHMLAAVSRQLVACCVRGMKSARQAVMDAFGEASRLGVGG